MSRRPPLARLLLWRARVPLAALALLACAVVVVGALRPAPEARVGVVVAARALEAGIEIGAADVRVVSWPRWLVPDGALEAVEGVTGTALAVAVPAGLPLVPGVLADESLWGDAPPGSVAAPVRFADAELAGMLQVGDRIDVLGVAHEGGPAERLARRALVLRGPAREESGGGLLASPDATAGGLVLLAVSPSEAEDLAAHSAISALVAVLVP